MEKQNEIKKLTSKKEMEKNYEKFIDD